ncbi:RNA polymerase subunit sigma-70 [Phytoactinopolyspora endophytica]|uniref:RNA polymerase subunit sigma-70 n=1 Tax=Phytoactinopolyspora endophytica TaxID=1642495 RepID=UPI00197B1A71|nr:RNA polymerase subunit sigma-70 [Phytoactinopolyspora endophytica]
MTGFEAATEPLRGELVAHSYRMLGSWADAEDVVQDALLRAWRAWEKFEHRSSVRTWLYQIATNVSLTALEGRSRRALPSALGRPEPDEPETLPPDAWVQPYAASRDDVRLALVASLQTLPPTQRAVWLLREVLAFPAAEVGTILNMSVAAVKSSLQRARAQLEGCDLRPDDIVEPDSPEARRYLDAYVTAFQNAEVNVLIEVLRADVKLEILPGRQWFGGRECRHVLQAAVGKPGDWRMEPTIANGQSAAVAYQNGEPYGMAVLDIRRDGLAAVTVFNDPELVARFSRAASEGFQGPT